MTAELYKKIRQYLCELIRGTEWEGHLFAVGGCCRDELMARLEEDAARMNALMAASTIPDRIDPDFVNSLMIEIRSRQFQ